MCFSLRSLQKLCPPNVVAVVPAILVSHGEIIMENLKNTGKDTVPNNTIPSQLRALSDFVKFHSDLSCFY